MKESPNNQGGKREGAGRKPKVDEDKIRGLACSAIEKKYGSIQGGFEALLNSGEPALIKFVYEHGVGKPKENVNLTGGIVFKLKKPGQVEDENNE